MIVSTGMRTDIPAFYSKWFINRIKEGYVLVRNPYYPNQVTRYLLDPNVVDCICFCTKNPNPMLNVLEEIKQYKQYWFVTISAYGKDYEQNVPNKDKIIEAFKKLSTRLGKHCVGWRYDPIFYGDGYDKEKHIKVFQKIAVALKGYTNTCVISFLDEYEKVVKNATKIYRPSKDEQMELVQELVKIARDNDMIIKSCCEGTHLAPLGVDISGCQTQDMIERAVGFALNVPNKKNVRSVCSCLLGQDIGAYNTCGHLCKYCYANMDKEIVLNNMKRHDPSSPFLVGGFMDGDKITTAKQTSYIDLQTSFL